MKLDFSIQTILAPLSEITDPSFRKIVRHFSKCLMFTEMISSAGAFQNNQKTCKMMRLEADEQPIGIQLFGHDPKQMGITAKKAEQMGASIIDINMGCPVKKIVSDNNGSALMKDEYLAAQIIQSVVRSVNIPVSAKFRLGWNENNINAVSFAQTLEKAGASMLTVHGRTKTQMYSGLANWDIIKSVKDSVNIPVIGNGDIKTPADAITKQKLFHTDGVMIGRASLGHPWIMGQIESALQGKEIPPTPNLSQQKDIIKYHFNLMLQHYGEQSGIFQFRKHICWYVSGLKGASKFRETINHTSDKKTVLELLEMFYNDTTNV